MRGRRRAGGRALLAAGAAAVALAGCGSSRPPTTAPASTAPASTAPASTAPAATTTASRPPAAAAAPTCRGSQLAASYAGTDGATGHMELTLRLRNVSATACRLRGYPGVRLLDGAGRVLPMHVRRGHGFFPDTLRAPAFVSLRPGADARFSISFATNSEYAHAHVCRTAAAAMTAGPGTRPRWQRVSLRTAPRLTPCGRLLVLSPVHG